MRESIGKKTNGLISVVSSEFHAWEHNLRPVPLNRIQDLSKEVKLYSKAWSDRLNAIIDSPLKWIKVIGIKKIEPQLVYDLCCERVHNFIADGILTHNCLVWLDELEKAFAGVKGESGDSGVSKRVFGNFLTWLSE
jgi:hypothetical protein